QGIFIDDQDRLYVVDASNKRVLIFNAASTLTGTLTTGDHTPDRILTVAGATVGALSDIAIDTRGTGYITDSTSNAIYIYDNIGSRSTGSATPDRTVSGPSTLLSGPRHLHLLPR